MTMPREARPQGARIGTRSMSAYIDTMCFMVIVSRH